MEYHALFFAHIKKKYYLCSVNEIPPYQPDFEEYIRQGEPEQKERALIWRTAIGLQQVDGLQTSDYLKDLARQHIEGDITLKKAKLLIETYYKTEQNRNSLDYDDKQEADIVSQRIAELLSEKTFSFNPAQLIAIHKYLFYGIFKFAGKIRDYNITKKEWILRGETIFYAGADMIRDTLQYDFSQEKEFDYSKVDLSEAVNHLARFCSNIWQIHPFGEGNTRTTAVFMIKYLRTLGFVVTNDMFAEHSWYFRNALVRANYISVVDGISYDTAFIERFFRNLLLGENNVLRNREMHLDWHSPSTTPSTTPATTPATSPSTSPATTPITTPASSAETVEKKPMDIDNDNVKRLLLAIGHDKMSLKQMMTAVGLKDRMNFVEYSLNPAMNLGFVRMLYPDSPHHPRQKYTLTVKGLAWFNTDFNN